MDTQVHQGDILLTLIYGYQDSCAVKSYIVHTPNKVCVATAVSYVRIYTYRRFHRFWPDGAAFLNCYNISVADLEIFRGGFSFTKTPAKLEVKTKKEKKVSTSFL